MKLKKIKPAGHRVLVRPDNIETKTEGGILLPENDKGRKVQAQVVGTLIDVCFSAWRDFGKGEPWAKAGDRVMFAKFAGIEVEIDNVPHRVMNDEDITAVVTV